MKKLLTLICTLIITAAFLAFVPACSEDLGEKYEGAIEKEMKGSFDFFWNEANTTEGSPAYGLIVDRWPRANEYGSIASVGFGLTAYVIGVEEGWVQREEAEERSLKTIEALIGLQQREDVTWEGFFAHFINMKNGNRYGNCEISSVDTAILLCGAVTAGEYFGGKVKDAAYTLYGNVNWKAFEVVRGNKTYISMSYNPDTGKVVTSGVWDWYAEQLMIYVLGAGSPTAEYRLDDTAYYSFKRSVAGYNGHKFIHSYFGSLFTYQYSHAWIDFSGIVDREGVNWFKNSVEASKAAYEFCRDRASSSKTFAEGGWGLTACDAPNGYNGYLGATPRGWTPDAAYSKYEGTVAPAGAIGSVVFTPKESLEALEYYQTLRLINGKYGLLDSYNLDFDYFADQCIGIDKGISIVMLSNYTDGIIWETFMQSSEVQSALTILGFTES